MAALPPKLRIAILLRYFDELSYAEMARALDCSIGTVASRLSRGHRPLAGTLAPLRSAPPAGRALEEQKLISIAGVILVASVSLAGELFRLEIGPPIAASAPAGKKAVLVVRPLCCDPATVRIAGTAEGIVDGSRRSIPLALERLATPGVHAVTRQWPAGEWVLNLTGTCAERSATATAVVPLDSKGAFVRERARFFARAATTAEIEASFHPEGSR